MRVNIPSPLQSYTGRQRQVEGQGSSLDEVLNSLNETFPGIRFRMIDEHDRIRKHIKIFVNKQPADNLSVAVKPTDEVHIICALSGG